MRSQPLHAALSAFVEEASLVLTSGNADGAEVDFELVEEGGRNRTPLYCYRPLVAEFVREHATALERLPSHGPAVRALARHDAVARYLKAAGDRVPREPGARAAVALDLLLARVFAETTDFTWDPERFAREYARLEETLFAGRTHAAVLVALHGLDVASPEVVLGDGLTLVRADCSDDLPSGADADVLVAFRAEVGAGDADPFAQAGRALRRLLAALRLYDEGGVALGPVAWTRIDDGPWRAVTLGGGGPAHGLVLVEPEDEDELRAFVNLVSRRTPRSGELAWALARHGMACERATPAEALSDVLLALRALLEPEGPASGLLPERLAALCAVPQERRACAERTAHAVALERAVMTGTAPAVAAVEALIAEQHDHLRALLRDVLCGHLDADLRGLADRLIAEAQPTVA